METNPQLNNIFLDFCLSCEQIKVQFSFPAVIDHQVTQLFHNVPNEAQLTQPMKEQDCGQGEGI